MSCTPSVQPSITSPSPNELGAPRYALLRRLVEEPVRKARGIQLARGELAFPLRVQRSGRRGERALLRAPEEVLRTRDDPLPKVAIELVPVLIEACSALAALVWTGPSSAMPMSRLPT
mgnify:CR=1 FL=1